MNTKNRDISDYLFVAQLTKTIPYFMRSKVSCHFRGIALLFALLREVNLIYIHTLCL